MTLSSRGACGRWSAFFVQLFAVPADA